jgi:hypothetical protein
MEPAEQFDVVHPRDAEHGVDPVVLHEQVGDRLADA